MNRQHVSPVPEFCNPMRFNLWMSTRNPKAPLLGHGLVEMCKGSPVNPFALGVLAMVRTREWADTKAIAQNDFWRTGAEYDSWLEAASFMLVKCVRAESVEEIEGLTPDDVITFRAWYSRFVHFSEMTSGVPMEDRSPVVTRSAPPVPPAPAPAAPPTQSTLPIPAPLPGGVTAPAVPAWRNKLRYVVGWVVGALGVAVTLGSVFIPVQFQVIARAVLAALKAIFNVL